MSDSQIPSTSEKVLRTSSDDMEFCEEKLSSMNMFWGIIAWLRTGFLVRLTENTMDITL